MTPEAVLRTLSDSPEILAGLNDGRYVEHGGVIRHAKGSELGGRIIAHLKYPSDPSKASDRIQEMSEVLQQHLDVTRDGFGQIQQSLGVLQGLQVANLALSGLNLAVSAAGFVIVCKKLDGISHQLSLQGEGITQLLEMAGEARDRAHLKDEARFRSLVKSTQQFCELGDDRQLAALLPRFNDEFEFTRLVLQRHARRLDASAALIDEATILQERLVHLGFVQAYVQQRIGLPRAANEMLTDLSNELASLNRHRIERIRPIEVAARMTRERFDNLSPLIRRAKDIAPAIHYQAELLTLAIDNPEAFRLAGDDHDEILLLAA